MNILLADSGATKTDWCLLQLPNEGTSQPNTPMSRYKTQGINPFHQSVDTIKDILREELLTQLRSAEPIQQIHFYGAGCTKEMKGKVKQALKASFPHATIQVESDLLGAARAVCGSTQGLVGILGTGANSCLYDGRQILENIPPLGYILGDEGSGAALGKRLLNALFKNPDYNRLQQLFLAYDHCTYADVIERVYRQPLANRYLASLVAFVKEYQHEELLQKLVVENFESFITANLLQYNTSLRDLYVVGGMAAAFPEALETACEQHGFRLCNIMRSPIEGLIAYHKENHSAR